MSTKALIIIVVQVTHLVALTAVAIYSVILVAAAVFTFAELVTQFFR